MKDKIYWFDTSLRDGAQTPWVNLTAQDKIKIAKQLEKTWIDLIEAWFAVSSPADFEAIQEIVKNTQNSIIYSLARMHPKDIETAYDALKWNIQNAWIHTFIWTSPLHREFKLKKSKNEILKTIEEYMQIISKTFSQTEHIMFSPEDALRTEKEFLFEAVQVAVDNWAKIINIPDTVWYAQWFEIYQLFQELVEKFPNTIFSIHCHNDLWNAVSNALIALQAWAKMIQWTVPPLFWERAWNTDLFLTAMNIKKRPDIYPASIDNLVFENFYPTVQMIENLSWKRVPPHYPVFWRLVHAHSSWIHQDGVNKNKETYEIISPEEIWMKIEKTFILTNTSWRAWLNEAIKSYFWIELTQEELNKIFEEFKKLTSEIKFITMNNIRELLVNNWFDMKKKVEITWWETFIDFSENKVVSKLVFKDNEWNEKFIKEKWVWPVDSIFKAFNRYFKEQYPKFKIDILDFSIEAMQAKSSAKARVYIKAIVNWKIFEEYGIDDDIVKASVQAYSSLIERI